MVQVICKSGSRRLSKALGFGAFAFAVAMSVIAVGQHQAMTAVAAGPTPVCGTLTSTTWNAAGSPYQICASGAVVPNGATVMIDGSGGPVRVQALGSGGLLVTGGTVVTSGTSPANNVTFQAPTTTPGSWQGLNFQPGSMGNLANVSVSYAGYGIAASNAVSLTLVNVTIDHSANDGINSSSTPLTVSGGMITNSGGNGIWQSAGSLTANGVFIGTAGLDGISFSDGSLQKPVNLNNNLITGAGSYGIYVYGGVANPIVAGNTITGSGLVGLKSPAIDLPSYTGDLMGGVSGNHGSGNGLDAIAFTGTVMANLTWLTPTNSASDHPFGYLATSNVTLASGTTLTVPQGSVVKFLNGSLYVNGATINATDTSGANAAKIFTTFRDPVGISTCPSVFVSSTCSVVTNDWAGINMTQDNGTGSRGNGAFTNTTIRYSYSDAISISSGATTNPAGGSFGLVLTNSTLDHNNSDAIYAQGTPVSVSGGTISNTTGRGIYANGANLTVNGTTISVTTAEGIYFSDSSLNKTVILTNNIISGAGSYGIYEYGGANPTVSGNTITGSGLVAPRSSAIDLPNFMGDLAGSVSGNHGSGNGLDAIAFAGTVTANLTWLTPTNSSSDHPLGYLAVGTVTLASGTTMTVPQGSVVKFSTGTLNVNGATINATDTSGGNSPKIFTTFRDPVGISTCPSVFANSTCGVISNDWGGINIIQDSVSGLRGNAAFTNSTIRYSYSDAISISSGATTNPAGGSFGLVLTNSTLDHNNSDALWASSTPVSVSGGTISNTNGRGIYAVNANLTVNGTTISVTTAEGIYFSDSSLNKTVILTNNIISGAGSYGIYEYGGANPTVSGNTITGSGLGGPRASAIDLPNFTGDLAGSVSGNHGSGNGLDAIAFAGTVTANLTWLTPTNSVSDHPFGYLAIGTVTLASGTTMTVPQGSVVKFSTGTLNVNGATITATDTSGGNSPKIFTTFRDPFGISTCPSVFANSTCGVISNDWGGINIIQDSVSGLRGNAAFTNTTIRYSYGNAISINSGATTNPAGGSFGLVLTNSTLDHNNSDALYAQSTPVSVSGGTISNTNGRGIYAAGGNLTVNGTTISVTTGEGIYFSDSSLNKTVILTNNTITGAGSYGIYEYGGASPIVSGNTITGSGLGGLRASAIDLPNFTGDLAGSVSGNHGSDNGLDAIAFAGTVTANMTWLTPTNSVSDHPFGYLAIGTVNLSSGTTLTVPQGSVVKFLSGTLNANGATINATDTSGGNSPKIFTTFRDPVGIPTCPSAFVSSTCGVVTNDWGGINIIVDSVSVVRGNAAFTNASIRNSYSDAISISSGATTNPAGGSFGLVLTNTTLDHSNSDALSASSTPVSVSGGTISNTNGRGIYAANGNLTVSGTAISVTTGEGIYFSDSSLSKTVSLTNNTITGAGTYGIYEYGGAANPTITGNNITGSGLAGNKAPAIDLPSYTGDLTGSVGGNHGSGNGLDAIAFTGTVTANLTWLTPTNSASDHPLGYLATGTVNLVSGTTMTVPQGSVVKFLSGTLSANGAIINATDISGGNAAKIFTTFRDPVGIATCPSVFVSSTCGVLSNDWGGISIIQDSTSGLRGSAAFTNASVRYTYTDAISISSGATTNPAGGSFGLVLSNTNVNHVGGYGLNGSNTSVSVNNSTFDTINASAAFLSGGTNSFVGDTFQNIVQSGIYFQGTTTSSVMTSRFVNVGGTATNYFAVIATGSVSVSLDCVSIHDNAGGFNSSTSGNQISGSDLFNNSGTGRFDLYSATSTLARSNWWGQPGGPVAGQIGGPGTVDATNPLTGDTPTVTVSATSLNTNANGALGSGTMRVTLTFNRKMNTTVTPVVTYSPGNHPVAAIGSGTGWSSDGLSWVGTATIDNNTTAGTNTINVSGGQSCVPEPTTNTMAPATAGFSADPTGTAAATTGPATGVFDTGATLNGTINPNGWTTGGYFQFGTTSGIYTNSTSMQAMGNGTAAMPITGAVTNLTPFTTYYFRTVSSTSNGLSYGAEQSFVTPSILHFPALMNNAYGGYTTTVYLQNKSGAALAPGAITITYFDTSGAPVGTGDSSPALANGAVWSVRQDNGHSFASGGAGSGRVNTSVPVVAFANQEIAGGDGSSYSALPDPATGATVYAPAVMNQAYGGYTTGFGITNTGSATTTVTVTYRNPDGSPIATTRTQSLAPNAYWGLYQGEAGTPLPVGFHGTATITSSPAQNLAVIVNEVGPGGFLTYSASNSGATTLYAPVVFNNAYGGYYTGMGIQNVSGSTANVTINYAGGSVTRSQTFTVAAHGFAGIYNGDGTLPSGFAGSAVITSDQPLVAIVNEVIGSQGTSYNTIAAGIPTVHLPLVENSVSGFSTGMGVENVGTGSATVSIVYYDSVTGAQVGTGPTLTLAPGAFAGVYQGPGGDGGVAAGHTATATLTVTNPGGGGKLAVIVNQQSSTSFMSYSGQ